MRPLIPTLVLLLALPALAQEHAAFPSWEERVVHQLTNRARVDPAADLAACPAGSCLEASCYSPTTPLFWDYDLNQAARFHSTSMGKFSFFAHDTPCVLFSDIDARFPGASDGSFASSCSSSGVTGVGSRVGMFGAAYGGENAAAGQRSPHEAFYGWLYEGAVTNSCGFTIRNGHRYNILLNRGPSLGVGHAIVDGAPYREYWTQDFGGAGEAAKIVSGSHWTAKGRARDASPGDDRVEFWANWYDVAPPASATVVLDNVSRTMTRGRGTAANGAYSATASNVSAGCHSYYFSFTDSSRKTVRFPATGALGFGEGCPDYQDGVVTPAAPSRRRLVRPSR